MIYGYGSHAFGWFPGPFLDRAVMQADAYLRPPHYFVPRVYERHGVRSVAQNEVAPGVTLISTAWKKWDWEPGLKLIDSDGAVLHEWRVEQEELFSDFDLFREIRVRDLNLHGSYLFRNGDVLVHFDYAGIARLNSCGDPVWRLDIGGHHSVARADDGTFWVPISDRAGKAVSDQYPDGYPGLDLPINNDRILHLSEDGQSLGELNILDVLYNNGLQRYLLKGNPYSLAGDIMHINDVEPLPRAIGDEYPLFDAGDLLISIRNANLVIVVDPRTEIVKWHSAEHFIRQHDPDFMGDGRIGIFDNNRDKTARGTMLRGSRIVALQPHTESMEVLFPTPVSDPFYTPYLGKWQLLDNGNLLLTEGTAGRIAEVAPDGRTVWEWIHAPVNKSTTAEVTEGTRYQISPAELATWPCNTIQRSTKDPREIDL